MTSAHVATLRQARLLSDPFHVGPRPKTPAVRRLSECLPYSNPSHATKPLSVPGVQGLVSDHIQRR